MLHMIRLPGTLGMMEQCQIDGIDFEIYEIDSEIYYVRCQLFERHIDCFNNVDALIFVAALSEYN
jgi:hypothetical protein